MSTAYVVDTHPLLFFASDAPKKLGRAARKAFERFERGEVTLYVPAAVVLETWLLSRNGTIRLDGSLERWWRKVESPNLAQVEMTSEDVWSAAGLAWAHRDIFDRLIVATALRLDCPLITRDGEITDWGGVDVIW